MNDLTGANAGGGSSVLPATPVRWAPAAPSIGAHCPWPPPLCPYSKVLCAECLLREYGWQRQCAECSRMLQGVGAGALAWWLGHRKHLSRGVKAVNQRRITPCTETARTQKIARTNQKQLPGKMWASLSVKTKCGSLLWWLAHSLIRSL